MMGSPLPGTSIFIAPYALDHVLRIHCRDGLSVIELDCWWHEILLDYGIMLTPGNTSPAYKSGDENDGRSCDETGHKLKVANAER